MTDVVKPDDGQMGGGFQIMDEAEYTLVFEDGIRYTEDKVTGETTENLMFPMKDSQGDGKIAIFCPLDKDWGFVRLSNLIHFSGMDKVIEKDQKLPSLVDAGWGRKVLKSDKLLKILQVKMPNRVIGAEVKHTKSDGKTYANVTKVWKAGDTPSPVTETSGDSESDEGWS